MSKRHRDALAINEGACNPSGICHSLLDACNEIRNAPNHSGTAEITSDPAVRLMVHQLAYICKLIVDFPHSIDYEHAVQACKEENG